MAAAQEAAAEVAQEVLMVVDLAVAGVDTMAAAPVIRLELLAVQAAAAVLVT